MARGFLEILNQLHDHHVDFVIVGGVAASLHGGSRVTFDLDIVPSLTPESWQATVDLRGRWKHGHAFRRRSNGFAMWNRCVDGVGRKGCWR